MLAFWTALARALPIEILIVAFSAVDAFFLCIIRLRPTSGTNLAVRIYTPNPIAGMLGKLARRTMHAIIKT